MHHPHDAFFRFVFEDPAHAAGELRAVLQARLADAIGWPTLRHVPGSFVEEELRRLHTDLLFEVRLIGRPALLYVLFEHQSSDERSLAVRLWRYVGEVRASLLRGDEPPAQPGPAVIEALTRQLLCSTETEREALIAAFAQLGPGPEALMKSTGERMDEALEARGRAEGEVRGRAELLLKLLRFKFGAVSGELEAKVRSADVATQDRWAEAVLRADTLEQALRGAPCAELRAPDRGRTSLRR